MFSGNAQISEIERLENEFLKVANRVAKTNKETAENKKTTTEEGSGLKYSLSLNQVRQWNIAWDSNNNSSIKEQVINHIDEINSMKPVADITYVKDANESYSSKLKILLKQKFGNIIHTQSYGDIIFDDDSINTLGNYINNDSEAAAALAAPYVIKQGRVISGHKNHKNKGSVSVTFAAPVLLNGKVGNVAVCVLYGKGKVHSLRVLTPEGKAFELLKIKKEEATTAVRSLKTAETPHITSSKHSIPNSPETVNKNLSATDSAYLEAVENGDMETA